MAGEVNAKVLEEFSFSGKQRVTRELNVRFLVGSMAVVATLCLAAYGIWTWQVQRTAAVLLRRADQLEMESKWQDAAKYVSRYVQLVPSSGHERVHLARVYVKGAQTFDQKQRAITLCYLAIAAEVPDEEISLRRQVGDLLLSNGRFIDADRKSTRLNSSHVEISYAVFCLKKKRILSTLIVHVSSAPLPHSSIPPHPIP